MIRGKAGSLAIWPCNGVLHSQGPTVGSLGQVFLSFYPYNIIIIIFYVTVTVTADYVKFNSILQQLAFSSFWKLVFISLISYIVCSLQTFLIAPIRSVAVRLKILSDWLWWQHDDYMITTWSLSHFTTCQKHHFSTSLHITDKIIYKSSKIYMLIS